MYLLIFLFILSIFILLLSLLTIKFKVKYLRQRNNDHLTLGISLMGKWLNYRLDIPKIRLKSKAAILETELELENEKKKTPPVLDKHKKYSIPRLYKDYFYWYPVIKDYLPAGKFLLGKTIPCRVKWQTEFGLSDAAQTGISIGILWAVKNTLLSYIYKYMAQAPEPPEIRVIPKFNEKTLVVNIDCIFNVKIGYIMITGIKCLRIFAAQLMHKILPLKKSIITRG